MRVLVTGGSGLIGSNVAAVAAQQSWDVLACFHRRPVELDGAESARLQMADRKACVALASEWEPDVIVHAAGESSLSRFEHDPYVGQLEFVGAEHTLAAARNVRARYVLVSCDQVYGGRMPAGWRSREGDLPAPVNAHGRSKLACEEAAMRSNVPWLIARPGEVYGANASIRGDGGPTHPRAREEVVAAEAWGRSGVALRLVARLRARAQLPAPEGGLRSPTYAWDFAERLCELIAQGCEGVYNLGGPATLGRHAWARLLAREFGCREELVQEGTLQAFLRACGERESVALPANAGLCGEKATAAIGAPALAPERGLALTRAALGETRLPVGCDAR
ncbi:MAG TPA: sugar nucleotide-binding protein [Solirubrobacteraceae bacterium]|jgi:dTDP-4-dehydrorhamnose reductase|nr:sugar nucleotide-binding protein [Solirubrobacteraceae bacterium]